MEVRDTMTAPPSFLRKQESRGFVLQRNWIPVRDERVRNDDIFVTESCGLQ